jgi:hypothetical protein
VVVNSITVCGHTYRNNHSIEGSSTVTVSGGVFDSLLPVCGSVHELMIFHRGQQVSVRS